MKIDYHIFKSALNAFFGMFIGRKRRPTFFDIKQTCPALDQVTRAYPVIRQEFDRLLADWNEFPQYHEVDPGERNISATTPKRWNVFMLEVMCHRPAQNRAACPETCAIVITPPTSRTDARPSTKRLRLSTMTTTLFPVSDAPYSTASPADMRRLTTKAGSAPMYPKVLGRADRLSVSDSARGVTLSCSTESPRTTVNTMGCSGCTQIL